LQTFAKTLPHVKGVVAYTDYLKQMNKVLNENQKEMYTLPLTANAAAQYFLLYSTGSASDDLENILDYEYQKANVRIYMDSGEYIHETLVFIMAFLSFRKLSIAVLVTTPVMLSILMIYGVMGYTGIWLGVGTSMFASIAIGLGIDFAVHTAERMQSLEAKMLSAKEQVFALYESTGICIILILYFLFWTYYDH